MTFAALQFTEMMFYGIRSLHNYQFLWVADLSEFFLSFWPSGRLKWVADLSEWLLYLSESDLSAYLTYLLRTRFE